MTRLHMVGENSDHSGDYDYPNSRYYHIQWELDLIVY